MIWSCPSRTSSPSIQPPKRLKRMLLCNGSAAIVDNENYKHNLSNANNAMFVRSITSIIILACIWGYVNLHNSMFSLVHNSPALAALNLWWLKLIVETKHATMRQDCVDALPRSRWCSCSCFPTFSVCTICTFSLLCRVKELYTLFNSREVDCSLPSLSDLHTNGIGWVGWGKEPFGVRPSQTAIKT